LYSGIKIEILYACSVVLHRRHSVFLSLVRNTANGKGYVGITTQPLHFRWQRHYSNAKTGGAQALARAIRKYGKEVFTIELLGEAKAWEELVAMERAAIQTYNTFAPTGHGYNLTLGGEGALGRIASVETRQRISVGKMGQLASPTTREAVGNRHRGIPKPAEQRQKISEAQLGSKHHAYGKPLSVEHKQKLSEAHTGRMFSNAQREAISASLMGKPKSESAKQKLREQALERYAQGLHPWIGLHHTEETKEKLSERSRAHIAEHGNPMQGRTHSEETRRKIAEKALGRIPWNKGTQQGPLSPETRAKLSAIRTGRPGYNTGKVATAETRAKMSAARQGGNNPLARAILLNGVVYPSIMDAARDSGYTRMQVKYRLKTGEATYVEPEKSQP
jgi:group I intron endonuclease